MARTCLVIKNDGVGDLIASSGIIRSLAMRYPGGLDLVTTDAQREVAERIEGVRERFYVSRDGLRHLPVLRELGLFVPVVRGRADAWRRDLSVMARLATRGYDDAIVLRRFIRASTLALMRVVRAQRRHAAFQFPTNVSPGVAQAAASGWELHDGDPAVLSEISYLARLAERASGAPIDPTPRLLLPASTVAVRPGHIGLCLGGASMRWGLEQWTALCTALLDSGHELTLFGGDDALADASALYARLPRCRSLVGKLSMLESVPELRSLEAYVGNDTGFSHLASLVVPRCMVLCGGGTFGRFFPWPGASNQFVVYHALECFDCNWQCKYPERTCLTRLSAAAVERCVREMLAPGWRGPSLRNLDGPAESYTVAWRFRDAPLTMRFDQVGEKAR